MSHQYSRAEAQCDYCGEKLNRHNIKAHTDSKHKVLPVKERFKRQSTLADFVTTGPKNAKLTEPAVTCGWLGFQPSQPASYHIGCQMTGLAESPASQLVTILTWLPKFKSG